MGVWHRLVWRNLDLFAQGLLVTFEICALAFAAAIVAGLVVCLVRLYVKPLRWVAIFWTPADLRRAWDQVGGLQVGDDLKLGYLGLEEWERGKRHSFACSVERGGAVETW